MRRGNSIWVLVGVFASALLVASSAVLAGPVYYDINVGLQKNTPTSPNTTWTGVLAPQTGQDGWYYLVGAQQSPWTGTHGASFLWPANISSYALMTRYASPGSASNPRGWGTNPGNGLDDTKGIIVLSNETSETILSAATGDAIAFRNGWNSSYFANMVAEWVAPYADTANVALTFYSASGNAYTEFQLALFRGGVFDSKLGYAIAVGTTNTGAGNGITLSATGVSVNAGDAIVLLAHTPDYNLYGTHQQNGAVSGGITIPEPATLGLLALGGLVMLRRNRRSPARCPAAQ